MAHSTKPIRRFMMFIKRVVLLSLFAALIIAVSIGYWRSSQTRPVVLQGQMEARETDVASKITGRIADILVTEGEAIEKGMNLVYIDSPEISAKISQAEAAQEAADAVAQKANNGARPQEIIMAQAAWQRAVAAEDVAEKSYRRVDNMAKQGLVSRQKRDEAYAQFSAASDQAKAAEAQYNMAVEGARQEDKLAAQAQARQVAAVLQEAQIAADESQLKSPVAGVVADVIAKAGEIVPKGVPVVTIVDLDDQWVVLQVREDLLSHFPIGKHFEATLPALSREGEQSSTIFTVFASSLLPNFATWRATRNNDGFDIRTFEIKARPLEPIKDMRPGMSVLVSLPARS